MKSNEELEDPEDYYDDAENECLVCGGEGMVETNDPLWDGFGAVIPCSSCGGSGLKKDMTWY